MKRWIPHLAAAGLCAAAVFAAFGRSLPYAFVYDDHWTVAGNPAFREPLTVARYFLDPTTVSHPAMGMGKDIYRPLPTLSLALNFAAAGENPFSYRLINLLLHVLNGWLLFLLIRQMGGSMAGAALGAGVFLLHPAQAESVVWITQRSNLMCAAGVLGALLLWGRSGGGASPGRAAAGFAALAFGLFSKETAAVTPLLLMARDAMAGRPGMEAASATAGTGVWTGMKKRLWLYAAAAGAVIAFMAFRHHVVGQLAQREFREGLAGNLMTGAAAWANYLRWMVWPGGLSVSHADFLGSPWRNPAAWIGVLLTAAWWGGAGWLWRKGRGRAAFSLAWVHVALWPVLGVVPLITFAAERFLYLPLAGAGLLAAWAWDALGRRENAPRLAGKMALGVWMIVLGILAFGQTSVWRSDVTLWEAAVRSNPEHGFARLCLAESLAASGADEPARQEYEAALKLPLSAAMAFPAFNNLAELAHRRGDPAEALAWSDKALALQPDSSPALFNKIIAHALLGQKKEALSALDNAHAAHPDDPRWPDLRRRLREQLKPRAK